MSRLALENQIAIMRALLVLAGPLPTPVLKEMRADLEARIEATEAALTAWPTGEQVLDFLKKPIP